MGQRLMEDDAAAAQAAQSGTEGPVGLMILPDDDHGPAGAAVVAQQCVVDGVGMRLGETDAALVGQPMAREAEQGLGDGHVDVDRLPATGDDEGLVDQPVAEPPLLVVMRLGQTDGTSDEAAQSVGLWQRLAVELTYPCLGAVGRDDDDGHVLMVGLGHGGHEVEQGRPRRDADGHGLVECEGHAEGIEAGRALVGDGMARDVRRLVQVVHNGGIAAARTHDGMTDAMGREEGGQRVDVFFIAIYVFH